ncbi:hypothetical protein [Pseudoalteromonas sp. NGC95]|uniref:hypothetical protein n=1 Tax=Pseudoalteromonas sp. NGC95 TaxID=2792051 RepID=UPI0018CFEA32|nr:hypothetical protein [Pseudoalteromonas sp. NGC95]MBH0017053.1 hypothetical protein [Pseudoalteromonas sp. NGC95]
MKFKLLFIFLVFISTFAYSNEIDEFWNTEAAYKNKAESYISQLYSNKPELLVIEFSIKRNQTKIESELEHYVFFKALDKASIVDTKDPVIREWAKSNSTSAKDITVYDVVFELPKTNNISPVIMSVGQETGILNNKWAELISTSNGTNTVG